MDAVAIVVIVVAGAIILFSGLRVLGMGRRK